MLTVLPLLLLAPQGLSATEHEISELLGDRWTVEAEVYSQAGPAVVSIELEGIVRQRDFFGRSRKQEGQLGQGTGVVIDSTHMLPPPRAQELRFKRFGFLLRRSLVERVSKPSF